MASQSVKLVRTDASQAPGAIQEELCRSLRSRQINPQFLYHNAEQARRWLKLHEAYSPARLDPDCMQIYEEAFRAAAEKISLGAIQVFGLSSGGAQKERTLLEILQSTGHPIAFSPIDVSVPLVLQAKQAVSDLVPSRLCCTGVLDLVRAEQVRRFLETLRVANHRSLFTFFGTIHNFEPETILPRLYDALRDSELLLLSANMVPAAGYNEKVRELLSAYDNELTRDWLLAFLPAVGLRPDQGVLKFTIQSSEQICNLKRITVHFEFCSNAAARVAGEDFDFDPGDSLRLFFSYRYTPEILRGLLEENGFAVMGQWLTSPEEEGVFLVSRAARNA